MTNRRDFCKRITATGAGLAVSSLFPRRIFSESMSGFNRIVYRELGSTGFRVSEIGFGAMNTRNAELIHAAIDAGINYIDTAYVYQRGQNEEIIGTVMKTKRDKVFLTTKLWGDEKFTEQIETSLSRLKTDHVDLVLLHDVGSTEKARRDDLLEAFTKIRDKGQALFIGLSIHSNQAAVIEAAVETGVWEALLVGYNYYSTPAVSAAIRKAREAGLAIIGMKNLLDPSTEPWKELADMPENEQKGLNAKQSLIKWVLEDRYVDTTVPGITSFEQLADDIAIMGTKMTLDSNRADRKYSFNTRGGDYCRSVAGCTGCLDKCPMGVSIGDINRCLRYAEGYGDYELARENYSRLSRSSRLDICDDCDECLVRCVNGLDLTDRIRRARELFV